MYKVYWFEYHNPLNWGNTYEKGIQNLKDSLPTKRIYPDPNEKDGWVQCECELSAETLEEAIELANEHCLDNGNGVFSIIKDGKTVFTEEDL